VQKLRGSDAFTTQKGAEFIHCVEQVIGGEEKALWVEEAAGWWDGGTAEERR
jgi:hypothetical protein